VLTLLLQTASAREDDTSLDLSGMPDVLRMDESHDVTITSLKDSTKVFVTTEEITLT